MWYEWETLEDFNSWHQTLCQSLGYPLTPINQFSGLPDEKAQKVEKYTDCLQVDDVFIAFVEDEYAEGLMATEKRPPVKPFNLDK